MPVIYLAAKMRGVERFNEPALRQHAQILRAMGHTVFSPAEKDQDDHGADFFEGTTGRLEELEAKGFNLRETLGHELLFIATQADAICVVPGWEGSKGVAAEIAAARAVGIPVAYLSDIDEHGVIRDIEDVPTAGMTRLEGKQRPAAKAPAESICQEADRLVSTDRQADYGHPLDNWTQTAALWSAILGVEVTAEQGLLCMIAAKISRETNAPKRDNLVDIAGYAKCIDLTIQERALRALDRAGVVLS